MENDIKINWNQEKGNINSTIDDMKVKQLKIKDKLSKKLKEIESIREDITYADREDKIYLRNELNSKRNEYDLLNKDTNEKDINLYLSSPYFTKIVTENDGFYISKYKKDFDRNIFLFTDPIAKLRFYDVNESEKINGYLHSVKEKIDYIIEESNLKLLTHYNSDYTYNFDGENLTVLKGEMPKVKKVLKPSSDRKIGMQEIIDRMKLEQDTVMRAPEVGITLISGGAGTGKTNMAIHRLKYLINEFGNMFKEENMALICFNVALKEYLTNVIEDLNLSNISIFSFDKWAYNLVRAYSNVNYINYGISIKDETIAAYKDYRFTKVLNTYISKLSDELKDELLNSEQLKFYIPQDYNFEEIITINNIFELRDLIKLSLLSENDSDIIKEIDKEFEAILKKYYVTEINLEEKKFTLNSTNILYKVYISEEIKEEFPNVFFFYKPLFQKKANQYELYAIMYLLAVLGGDINEELKIYDHIAVDEVQDFLPIQLSTLEKLSAYSMTLTGDIKQKIFNTNNDNWDALGVNVDNYYELKEVHRSTIQTVNFANALIGNTEKIINDNSGKKPLLNIVKNYNDSIKKAIEDIKSIKENNKEATIVVLYPDSKHISNINDSLQASGIESYVAVKEQWDFTKEVAVTNYHQVKGLEFDNVIILGLTEFESYGFNNKEKLLYTILTRAKERVYMYSYNYKPQLFKNLCEDLYEIKK